jgi:hypothetical protein
MNRHNHPSYKSLNYIFFSNVWLELPKSIQNTQSTINYPAYRVSYIRLYKILPINGSGKPGETEILKQSNKG